MQSVKRVIEYRKALWVAEKPLNLQVLVEEAWQTLPLSTQRVVLKKDQTSTMGMELRAVGAAVGFQGCRYVDRQSVGVVPMSGSRSPVLTEQQPAPGENFLSSDFFVLVSGNDVITLNAGRNAATAKFYLHGLFPMAGMSNESTQFDLVQQASPDVVRKIQVGGGVESIQFDMSITEATASLIEDEGKPVGINDRIASGLSKVMDMISKPVDRRAIKDSSGSLRLQLRLPKGELQPVQQAADRLAVDIVEDDDADDYVIVLRNGETIRPRHMSTRKSVPLKRSANSFVADDVYAEMQDFLRDVRASGLAEV
ncbi:hypothetical protein [Paragemmobacter straminiformis]|uniref:Uncharacterized protein n=1 Tax=Paragemmobacter straminiformis TaxID=2045119 RepID=A0A842I3P4_9RHOB|nr:hypothetical protein [Gemmobacter straminiformis]MBC2834057.1 hypothetical protein [Gemmobacter straminiformis]